MRERKKAGFREGSPEVCPPQGVVLLCDTPTHRQKLRAAMFPTTVVLRTVAGALWRAVRRSPGAPPPATVPSPSLTIGALSVNITEPPAVPGVPTTRRSLAFAGILGLADTLIIARYALARALDKLQTEDVLELFDEVAETVEEPLHRSPLRVITPRDENQGHT